MDLLQFFVLFDDIIRMSRSFDNFITSHIRRNGNGLAHMTTRESVEVGNLRIWHDPFPEHFLFVDQL